MKNSIASFFGFLLFSLVLMSFTSSIDNTEAAPYDGNNSCTVTITSSYGSAAKSTDVKTVVSGNASCMGGRTFTTDSDGEVDLEWSAGCKLKKVYIKGNYYNVDYKDGGNYSLKLK